MKPEIQNEPLVLSFDYGTQSVRAILFDKKGNLIGKKKVPFTPYYSLHPGWAEQKPELYWEKFCEASKLLKAEYPEEWKRIKAVSCTTIRDTCVCMDKNGKVLRPIIVWLDQRECCKVEERVPLATKLLMKAVGMYETIIMQLKYTPSNWIEENEPEVFKNTYRYMMFSGFITYLLTGNMVDSVASQVGHIPFDYKKKKWQTKSALTNFIFATKADKMPDIIEPGKQLGTITAAAAEATGIPEGTPVIAAGSDKGCETLGTGTVGSETASLSFGTTATIQITTDKYVEPQRFVPSYPAVLSGKFNPEVQIYRGYWMLTWFKQEFAQKEVKRAEELGVSAEEVLNQRLKEVPPGSQGLVVQPYWSPGLKTPTAKGAVIGFSDVHTRIHLYRAIIEGIGYGLYDGLKAMEKSAGYNIKRVMVSGGGAQSDEICQITADMFGVKVCKVQTYETSALGAAISAFVGLGVYPSFEKAMENMVHPGKEYLPNMEVHKNYDMLYNNIYKRIYPANKKTYDFIYKYKLDK